MLNLSINLNVGHIADITHIHLGNVSLSYHKVPICHEYIDVVYPEQLNIKCQIVTNLSRDVVFSEKTKC